MVLSLTLVAGAIFLRPGERAIVLDRFQAFDPQLIFEGVQHFVDRELERSEVFHWPCSFEADLVGGYGAPASCREVVPRAGLECGWELYGRTSTSLQHSLGFAE